MKNGSNEKTRPGPTTNVWQKHIHQFQSEAKMSVLLQSWLEDISLEVCCYIMIEIFSSLIQFLPFLRPPILCPENQESSALPFSGLFLIESLCIQMTFSLYGWRWKIGNLILLLVHLKAWTCTQWRMKRQGTLVESRVDFYRVARYMWKLWVGRNTRCWMKCGSHSGWQISGIWMLRRVHQTKSRW